MSAYFPARPLEISPFLSVREHQEEIFVRDVLSGLAISFNLAGQSVFNGILKHCSSYTLSEFLFRTLTGSDCRYNCSLQSGLANTHFANIRVAPAALFHEYICNTAQWRKLGNERFAKKITSSTFFNRRDEGSSLLCPREPLLLYHSWKPGVLGVGHSLASSLFEARDSADTETQFCMAILGEAGWLAPDEVDIDSLVERVSRVFIAIQNEFELRELLKIVNRRKPRVILEIGTARGGLLFCLSQVAAPGALIISIDLPGSSYGGGQTASERSLFKTFARTGQKIEFIVANSQRTETKEALAALLQGQKIDLLVIDGDHSYSGVRSDFLSYRPFMAKGGLIAIHDILLLPDEWGPGNEVGIYWRVVRSTFSTSEIIDSHGVCARNPVSRPRNWGFGLVEVDW